MVLNTGLDGGLEWFGYGSGSHIRIVAGHPAYDHQIVTMFIHDVHSWGEPESQRFGRSPGSSTPKIRV